MSRFNTPKFLPCLDLEALYGHRYRIQCETFDEACPWLVFIPCGLGHIYPHSDSLLAASTDTRGPGAKRLMGLGVVWQDGQDGVTVLFGVKDMAKVAKIMKPRRKRVMTPEQRAKLVAMGAKNLKNRRAGSSYNELETQRNDGVGECST